MGYVSLSKMPDAKREYAKTLGTLAGGLNLWELDYRVRDNESPEMQNLMWRDGAISCRNGQTWLNDTEYGVGYTAYERLWRGYKFAHIGANICAYDSEGEAVVLTDKDDNVVTVPENRGTFFLYNEKLYYKNRGGYISVTDYDLYDIPEGTTYYSNVGLASVVGQLGEAQRGRFFSNERADVVRFRMDGVVYYVSTADCAPVENARAFVANEIIGYVPVTYINADARSGAGDSYQPENRLSASKTIWYNAAHTVSVDLDNTYATVSVEGTSFIQRIPGYGTYVFTYSEDDKVWKYNNVSVDISDYGIFITTPPEDGSIITIKNIGINVYHLPVQNVEEIFNVKVDGTAQVAEVFDVTATQGEPPEPLPFTADWETWSQKVTESGTYVFTYNPDVESWQLDEENVDITEYGLTCTPTESYPNVITVDCVIGTYLKDLTAGTVTFKTAPSVPFPYSSNTVEISYTKSNAVAYNNIMDCPYVAVYGGTGALCIAMAGSLTQPNAYFWNGQTSIEMDASYFPMTQYQLAGDTADPIRGFGKQQSYLVIFKESSVGRTSLKTETVDERLTIDLPYVPINALVGCDLPWSIQLIDNNLVWCNSAQGVHVLKDSSSAYEQNIVCISRKVNGGVERNGLLWDVRNWDKDCVCSADDDHRYWLCANGHAWVWDYELSEYKDPSWFYFTNIKAQALIHELDEVWHINRAGQLTVFRKIYNDYGEAINKIFRFAVQNFNTYDVLKNVNSVIINTRPDTDTTTHMEYITDYETRADLTDMVSRVWRLVPRDLSKRALTGRGFTWSYRRRPMCRRVRHFTMRLSNNTVNEDLSIISAQIFYNYQGRFR